MGQERRRRNGRRAPADRTVNLDRLATQNPFAPLLAQGEQETVHMETLRHVITQCKATSANREMAVGMHRECLQAKAEMSTEAGLATARAFTQQAADGWAAVQQGQAVSLPTWKAMHGVLGGALPEGDEPFEDKKDEKRKARMVGVAVNGMQSLLQIRLEHHRRAARPVTTWIREREDRRGLVRSVFAAWAEVRGSSNVPGQHVTAEEWAQMRSRETARDRRSRRLQEAVKRVTSWASTCFNRFWAERSRRKRMLRVKIAIMRKARLTKNWGRVRGVIQNMLQRTRTVREASRWPKRRRAVMQDVVECMKREAAGMRGNNRGGPGVTRRTVANLLHATVVGPVLLAQQRVCERQPFGDG